ncbi:PD-(D/E)XK nuclease family protein [Rickettsiella endosymbiont of Miltochrista miniata]|uniref:PD-(D/E)XK nuclease family protein n=1 Tax=Rickettsiella endosymbiont of Miltochrista miniata TaxID=3066239 RepID=UPI00313C235E
MEIYNKLFKRLNPEDLLLTGNKRLIPFLHKAYAQYQQTQKKQIWPTPQFFTFTHWLETLWEKQLIEQTGFCLRLLNKSQECLIWKTIIQQSAYSFLDTTHTAKNAQQAWQLLQQAQLDYQTTHFKQSNETETWQAWATHFLSFCQSHTYVDLSSAVNHLILLFSKRILKFPPRIFLIGFNEINPQYKRLLKILEEQHCEICHYTPIYSATKQQRLCLSDKESEYHTMALWAYQSWQQGKKNIACVIPNLIEQRTHLFNIFTEVFNELAPDEMHAPPFNIAAGNPLIEFGLIQTAIQILGLEDINSFVQINPLLRSPYLGGSQQEQTARAQLDITLRCSAENRLSLDQLLRISNQQACPLLSGLITQLIPLVMEYPTHFLAKPSFWSEYFTKKLHALAWPGDGLLNSSEFQLLERWSELLTEFASLDFILGDLSHAQALQQLQELMANTLFQSKTLHEPPIQVLGLLDSAGMYFDAVWVMGLDDRTWPAVATPNPFIPYALQRTHQIPYASSEREYYFASLLTKNLIGCTENIIFSHPAQHLDQMLRPSVLIKSIPEVELIDLQLPAYQSLAKKIMRAQHWEYYLDEPVPLPTGHGFNAATQLLQSQAACPFQAYARWRLKAYFHPFPHNGLNAVERGSLLHQVLEQFWNVVQNQASLLQQTPSALEKIINDAIDHCLNLFSKKRPLGFKRLFIDIERRRLQSLLSNLIALEKQRPAFMQTQHETKKQLTLGALSFKLRIDRIDKLSATQYLIIDYKTGAPSKIDWLEERCDYPQLPLYCLSHAETVRSFAIMHLRSNKITLQGISAEESIMQQLTPLKKLKTALVLNDWSDLLKHWQTSLEKLAIEFQQGVADVHPKHGPTTCRHCDLQLFCRINHQPHTVTAS